jgi:hypothetical protein
MRAALFVRTAVLTAASPTAVTLFWRSHRRKWAFQLERLHEGLE